MSKIINYSFLRKNNFLIKSVSKLHTLETVF